MPDSSQPFTQKITILKNGPYRVTGNIPLAEECIESDHFGIARHWRQGQEYPPEETRLICRCGKSEQMPFCDNTHAQCGFDGTETAGHSGFAEMAETITGPGLVLEDAKVLCASARFCLQHGGIWKLVTKSGDPEKMQDAVRIAWLCPAGRLVVKSRADSVPIEPEIGPSVSIVRDSLSESPGPLWVKGGIPVEGSDGFVYETRNRVTLCCCGKSKNKPFCDGAHVRG